MPINWINRIDSYTGADADEPQFTAEGAIWFDTLRIPKDKAQDQYQTYKRPGQKGHGVMRFPPQAREVTAIADRTFTTTAFGNAVVDLLLDFAPHPGNPSSLGVAVVENGVMGSPYDLIGARVSDGSPMQIGPSAGKLTPNGVYLFRFEIRLQPRADFA